MKRSYLTIILGSLWLVCLNPVVARAATIEMPGDNLNAQNPSLTTPDLPTGGPGVVSPAPDLPTGGPGIVSPTPAPSGDDLLTRTQEAGKKQEEVFQQRKADVKAAENQRRETRQAEYDTAVKKYEENKVAREQVEAEARKIAQAEAFRKTQTVAEAAPAPNYPAASKVPPQSVVIPLSQSNQSPKAEAKSLMEKLKLGQISFLCSPDSEPPATIARINGKNLNIILWVSDLFASKGFAPRTRCQQVSARLEEYSKKHTLTYLTIGELNKQPVICVTSKENGSCGDSTLAYAGLLFTLKPNSNSQDTLKQLADVLQDNKGKEKPLQE